VVEKNLELAKPVNESGNPSGNPADVKHVLPQLLIIDDDESVRKVLRFRLQHFFEIIDSGSPEEALALALHHKPDAILLDLMMPKYSGFEICQTLSALSFTRHIPIFIVSGESGARYKEFCESLGAKGYFQKPVDLDALQKTLTAFINGHRHDRRGEPRVRLRVTLKLRGFDVARKPFEFLTATENVSANGFLCGCNASIKADELVEVFHAKDSQQFIGKARIVRLEWADTPGQKCAFQFIERPIDWVLN
jgi:CheY-like chemotaxis protein